MAMNGQAMIYEAQANKMLREAQPQMAQVYATLALAAATLEAAAIKQQR